MFSYTIVSYLHLVLVFGMFSSVIVEATILKSEMTKNDIKILSIADLIFGITAGMTIIIGLLRMLHYGKGEDYYLNNPLFVFKLIVFSIIGMLSLYPTLAFRKARKMKKNKIHINNYKTIRLIILFEIILLLIIPLLAVLVANGI